MGKGAKESETLKNETKINAEAGAEGWQQELCKKRLTA